MPLNFLQLGFSKPKTAGEAVERTVTALENLEEARREKQVEKALEQVSKNLQFIKHFLFGEEGYPEPTKESVIACAHQAIAKNLPSLLIKHLKELDFESRKDAAQVFGAIVRIKDADDKCPGAEYVMQHLEIIDTLFAG